MPFDIYQEDDPRVAELLDWGRRSQDRTSSESGDWTEKSTLATGTAARRGRYTLLAEDGGRIDIPEEGGVVGRTGLGAEYLASFFSVSRQHLQVMPCSGGVLLKDISSYGTFVDGRALNKGEPVRAVSGARITLCNVDFTLCGGE